MESRSSNEENPLWGNPCVYGPTISKRTYEPILAENLARQAKYVLEETMKYKDELAELYTLKSFGTLYSQWDNNERDDWLRKFPWHIDGVMPRNKVLHEALEEADLGELMKDIDEVLPYMYKSLKMVVAAFQTFAEYLNNDNIAQDANLAKNIKDTVPKLSKVLCLFFDVVSSRDLKILPLLDNEVPEMNKSNQLTMAYVIYRDTLNYLEYISHVFDTMAKTDLSHTE